jgi:SAM-dependent methyltransferase
MRGRVDLSQDSETNKASWTGLSGPEPSGRWTEGPHAAIHLRLPQNCSGPVLIKIDLAAFVAPPSLKAQAVEVSANGVKLETWTISDQIFRRRAILVQPDIIGPSREIALDLSIPSCTQPSALGLNRDMRHLGIFLKQICWEQLSVAPVSTDLIWQLGRPVGGEARKSFDQKVESGFWARFVTGPHVLDVGFRGYDDREVVPILEGAIGIDLDYPGYDGRTLPFPENSQDAVFSSHCLEHIPDFIRAIQEWHRVAKIGGHIITVVPSAHLYERRERPPSRHNDTHVRFYTPASLLAEFETALRPNSYRVRHLVENDEGYRYDDDPDRHPRGCYEIELVVQKLTEPGWKLG